MKYLRGFIPTTILAAVLVFSTTVANAGIIIPGAQETPTNTDQCSEPVETKIDWGIIIPGFAGIIIPGLSSILTKSAPEDTQTNCGIIIPG